MPRALDSLMVLGTRDLRSARGGCLGARVQPFGPTQAGVVTYLQGLGVDPGPSPVVLRCGGVRREGCGRPGSFKGNDGRNKRRSVGRVL